MTVDRVDDASQDSREGLILEGMGEVGDREIVGHRELPCIGDHDLDVPASVVMSPRRYGGASNLGQTRGNLDADDPAEGPCCGLMDDSTLPAAEVHEGVAVGHPEVAERSGHHVPVRWDVTDSIGVVVLGLMGIARGVESSVQHAG